MSATKKQSSSQPDRAIVVGTDGSPSATTAVRRAAALARAEGARLHIVTAYDPSIAPEGRHAMSVFAQYVPYTLAAGDWTARREDEAA